MRYRVYMKLRYFALRAEHALHSTGMSTRSVCAYHVTSTRIYTLVTVKICHLLFRSLCNEIFPFVLVRYRCILPIATLFLFYRGARNQARYNRFRAIERERGNAKLRETLRAKVRARSREMIRNEAARDFVSAVSRD